MTLYNADCLQVLKEMPDKSVDLVVTDPPYLICSGGGGGCFGTEHRGYHQQVSKNEMLNRGIPNDVLEQLSRVMKKTNIYLWCNKNQLGQYIEFFEARGCTTELLTWHKTNPVPTCNNKYLSDTEYLLLFREPGAKLYGTYATKHKYWITPCNKADKDKYHHPTIKPLPIIETLIINSSVGGGVVLDPFMGSGTTGVACKKLGREFIGIEIDKTYFDIAQQRINGVDEQLTIEGT